MTKNEYRNKQSKMTNIYSKAKKAISSKAAKRAYWTIGNVASAMLVAYLTYMATDNEVWAATALPLATALSQYFTKSVNGK